MLRSAFTAVLVIASAIGVAACDGDDAGEIDDVDTTIVDGPGVPFDPAVPEGVDTDTDEVGNQGFDSDDNPGPEGNVSQLPAED
jgi:hypothetical protein